MAKKDNVLEIINEILKSNAKCFEKAFIDIIKDRCNNSNTDLNELLNNYLSKILKSCYASNRDIDINMNIESYKLLANNRRRKISTISQFLKCPNKIMLLIDVSFSSKNLNLGYTTGMIFCKCDNKMLPPTNPGFWFKLPLDQSTLSSLVIPLDSRQSLMLWEVYLQSILRDVIKEVLELFFKRF